MGGDGSLVGLGGGGGDEGGGEVRGELVVPDVDGLVVDGGVDDIGGVYIGRATVPQAGELNYLEKREKKIGVLSGATPQVRRSVTFRQRTASHQH